MKPQDIRKTILVILVVMVMLAGGLALFKIANKTDDFHFRPEVLVSGVTIEDSGDESLRVYPTIHVINDVNVEARVRELEYELSLDGLRILRELEKKNFNISKQDTTMITLSARINKNDLRKLRKKVDHITSDSAMFHMHLLFRLDVPIRDYRQFEVNRDIMLPVLRLLVVESRKLSLEKFSLKHPRLRMDMQLRNPNSFPMSIDDCRLKLSVGDDLKLDGSADGVQQIKAHSSTDVILDLDVKDMNAIELAWKSLVKDDKTPFKSRLSFRVVSKNKAINRSQFVILKDGMLDEIK
jgi:LEA14-like dessication related protein